MKPINKQRERRQYAENGYQGRTDTEATTRLEV